MIRVAPVRVATASTCTCRRLEEGTSLAALLVRPFGQRVNRLKRASRQTHDRDAVGVNIGQAGQVPQRCKHFGDMQIAWLQPRPEHDRFSGDVPLGIEQAGVLLGGLRIPAPRGGARSRPVVSPQWMARPASRCVPPIAAHCRSSGRM